MRKNGLTGKKAKMARAAWRAAGTWNKPDIPYHMLAKMIRRVSRWHRAAKGRK